MAIKPYKIILTKAVKRNFDKFDSRVRNQIWKKIKQLAINPRPPGTEKIKGTKSNEDYYRIRSGNYRIIYTIKDNELIVSVVNIGHRQDVYKNFFN